MGKYDDIIHLPRPGWEKGAPMSLIDRGAQFSPFAALTGFDLAIDEAGRLTQEALELTEEEKGAIDHALRHIAQALPGSVPVELTWFCPDDRKAGGRIRRERGAVVGVDPLDGSLLLADGREIPFDRLIRLQEGERDS